MPTSPSFDFVLSAENNHYLAWQAMLFHYSCVKHMDQVPIVVVHGEDEPLKPQFQRLADHGGRIQRAKNFRHEGGWEYPPRNTAGSLSVVSSDADYLVICDPDIMFCRPLPLDQFMLPANQITCDRVSYMYVADDNREMLQAPSRAAGIDLRSYESDRLSGGVPHIIPRCVQQSLSADWLKCMTFFEPTDVALRAQPGSHVNWVATMWALLFAAERLGLDIVMTDWCVTNCPGTKRLDELENEHPFLIHYCYGDEEFDKRKYTDESGAETKVWGCSGSPGTVNELITGELTQAAQYFCINAAVEAS